MNTLSVRKRIERELDNMSEEQLTDILDYITRMLKPINTDDYDESRDMTIGFIKDSTTTSQQADDKSIDSR